MDKKTALILAGVLAAAWAAPPGSGAQEEAVLNTVAAYNEAMR